MPDWRTSDAMRLIADCMAENSSTMSPLPPLLPWEASAATHAVMVAGFILGWCTSVYLCLAIQEFDDFALLNSMEFDRSSYHLRIYFFVKPLSSAHSSNEKSRYASKPSYPPTRAVHLWHVR